MDSKVTGLFVERSREIPEDYTGGTEVRYDLKLAQEYAEYMLGRIGAGQGKN